MKFAITIIAGMCVGLGAAHATPPRVVRPYSYYDYAVIPYYQPLPVYVPAYSVGMQQQALTDPAVLAALERIAAALERQGQPLALKAEPPHVALMRQNCAGCHGVSPKGNKLVLFSADGWREPSPELLSEVIARVSSGSMPKGQKMAADDRLRLIAGLMAPEAKK